MSEPLEPTRWDRVERLFEEALAKPEEERAAFLAGACEGDELLRAEVESLLAASDEGMTRQVSAVDHMARELMGATAAAGVGRKLGRYRLEEEIGRGGMGVVYRGVRTGDDFEQTVAVKVLPGALFSPETMTRFRNERRILAGLEHPNITRLLDGGATPEGVPYVVMEYVDGRPLDHYVDEAGPSLEDRIWLFLAICAAVQYAHRNLVVHRDLKPSNILVTGEGVPKLLDFGIAKLLDAGEGTDATGTRIMTPRFASPEQLLGQRIGTSTDVYSLGLLLYWLLAGVLPRKDAKGDREGDPGSQADAIRAALEGELPPPSQASGDRRLAGDLDTIVLKALRLAPEERYESAAELAGDLQRYLSGRPITARPPSLGYRARKFVARNRAAVLGAALAVVVLLGQSGLFVRRLSRERDLAREQADRAKVTLDFLTKVFGGADPFVSADPDISALELLGRGTSRLEGELVDQPEVKAEILTAVGDVYENLLALDSAQAVFQRALAIREATNGPNSLETARQLSELAGSYIEESDLDGADSLLTRSLAIRRAHLPPNHPDLAVDLGQLARVAEERGAYPRGDSLFRAALTILENPSKPRDDLHATILANYGVLLRDWDHLDEAEARLRESLALRKRIYGERHPQVAVVIGHLAWVRYLQGRYGESEAMYRDLLQWAPPLVGDKSGWPARWLNGLAGALKGLGRDAEALEVQKKVVEAWRNRTRSDPDLATALNNLSNLQSNLGRLDEAQASLEEALALNRRIYGDDNPAVATNLNNLAKLVFRRGDPAGAARLQAQVLEMDRRQLGEKHQFVAADLTSLGNYYLHAGDLERAGPFLRQGLDLVLELRGPDDLSTAAAQATYADWLVAMGRGAEADSLARAALTTRLANLDPTTRDVALARSTLGAALTLLGRWDEAEKELTMAARILETAAPEADPLRIRNEARLEALRRTRANPDSSDPSRQGTSR